jgi:hypothetical protein
MDEQSTNEGTTTAATGTVPASNGEPQGGEKQLPQSQVNALIGQTRKEARESLLKEFGVERPDDLKALLERAKTIEDVNKTEAQKTADRLAALEKEKAGLAEQNARLQREHTEALIRSAVVSEAAALGFHDPMDAFRLMDLSKLKLTEAGTVEGAKDALAEMGKAKPWMVQATPRINATRPEAGGVTGSEKDADRRKRLFGTGGDLNFGSSEGVVYHPK